MASNYRQPAPNAMVAYNAADVLVPDGFDENIDLIIQTYAKDLTPIEMSLFAADAHQRGLSIVKRQIYATKYSGRMTIMVGIDGYRAQAEATGDYAGQDGPYWCGPDGLWKDVWLGPGNPTAAKVGVYRKGFEAPIYGVALWSEYSSTKDQWKRMPAGQLAKCAEALALRKACPDKLGGTYTPDEMDQASVETTARVVDRETGEVRPPMQVAPVADWDGASKLLHATAAEFGITHDDLHNWAEHRTFGSIKNATEAAMRNLAKDIRQRPESAKVYFARLRTPAHPATPEPVDVESRPINTSPPTQEEIDAALEASTPASVALPGVSGDESRTTERFLN